jgi:type II secretory pathway pseudopilin PulG
MFMIQINPHSFPRAVRSASGMTLLEMMVGIGVGSLVLLSVIVIFMTSSRSFEIIGNYVSMDRASRNALDHMTKEIRKSYDVLSYATNTLKLKYDSNGVTNLVYNWSSANNGQLTEQWIKSGSTNTSILLTNCNSLVFSMFMTNTVSGGSTYSNTVATSSAKMISVAWTCSRSVLGKTLATEDMQEAQVVLRNKTIQ